MSNLLFSNKESQLKKIQTLSIFLGLIDKIDYKEFGLVSCFYNTMPTRILCPKCKLSKSKSRSRVYTHTKGVAHHLTKVHGLDSYSYPTLEQSLKLIEIHSIMLQLKVLGI